VYKIYSQFSKKRFGQLKKRDELKGDLSFASRHPKTKKLKELAEKYMKSNSLSLEERYLLLSLTKEKMNKLKKDLQFISDSKKPEQL
jgi:hypothetical protein